MPNDDDADSLFGSEDSLEDDGNDSPTDVPHDSASLDPATSRPTSSVQAVKLDIPTIDGLYLFRDLLAQSVQGELLQSIVAARCVSVDHPQAMFFPRSLARGDVEAAPAVLADFVRQLPDLLRGVLPEEDFPTVFDQSKALQTIINLYEPGKGISPHVDLPHRYAEPIIGISLLSSTVMDFTPLDSLAGGQAAQVLLRPGDVYILLRSARYSYKHGIAYREFDTLDVGDGTPERVVRGTRLSITFRRMKEETMLLSRPAD